MDWYIFILYSCFECMVFNLRWHLPAGMLKNKITFKILNFGIKKLWKVLVLSEFYNLMSEALLLRSMTHIFLLK